MRLCKHGKSINHMVKNLGFSGLWMVPCMKKNIGKMKLLNIPLYDHSEDLGYNLQHSLSYTTISGHPHHALAHVLTSTSDGDALLSSLWGKKIQGDHNLNIIFLNKLLLFNAQDRNYTDNTKKYAAFVKLILFHSKMLYFYLPYQNKRRKIFFFKN